MTIKTIKPRLTIPVDFVMAKRAVEGLVLPLHTLPIANLDLPVEWMRFCGHCAVEQRFIADRVCINGLIGECTGCGDERIAPFSRVNSEVA
jgi:hypothetical protein